MQAVNVVAAGTPDEVAKNRGQYDRTLLSGNEKIDVPKKRRTVNKDRATCHSRGPRK